MLTSNWHLFESVCMSRNPVKIVLINSGALFSYTTLTNFPVLSINITNKSIIRINCLLKFRKFAISIF